MQSKCFFLLPLFVCLLVVGCKKDEFTLENQKVSGSMTWTQKSFTPTNFDAQGMPTKAAIVQTVAGTLSNIGALTSDVTVNYDLVNSKSEEVLATYADNDGDTILTKSNSVGNPSGLTITETITGGTGKFSKITGGGTYSVLLDFATGNGTGTMEWTVTY